MLSCYGQFMISLHTVIYLVGQLKVIRHALFAILILIVATVKTSFITWAKFQTISKTNMENRAKMQYQHLGGTRSFMYHKRRLGINDDINLYKRMHSKNNKWICSNAREKYEKMLELQNSNNQEESGEALTPRKIMTKILGKKSGYICGLGRAGPRSKSKNSSCSGSCSSSAADSQLAELQQKYDNLQKKLNMFLAEKELEQRQQPEPLEYPPYVQQSWMQPRRHMGPVDYQTTHNWYQQPPIQHQSEVGAMDPYGTQHWHGYNGPPVPQGPAYRPDYLPNYNVYPTQQQSSQERCNGRSRNGDLPLRGPTFRPDYHPTNDVNPQQQHSPQDRYSGSRNGDSNV